MRGARGVVCTAIAALLLVPSSASPASPFRLTAAPASSARFIAAWAESPSQRTGSSAAASIRLTAASVRQGGVIGITVASVPQAGHLRVRFAGRSWPLYRTGPQASTYVGTDPFTKPGRQAIVVEVVSGSSVDRLASGTVTVVRETFAVRRLRLDPTKEALFDPKLVAIERRKVGTAFRQISPMKRWDGSFALPTTARRSSPYGVRSIYNGKMRGWHRGTDFAAPAGSPVRAANHGLVRLAEQIPLSGNAVLIDHGLGVFTTYMHMSSIAVRAGREVRKGDVVGTVGSTGVATGPHLHWGLRVNGLYVDPLLWVAPQP